MTITSQFDAYVRRRLDSLGREFALHRDIEILGHKSKDILQVLMEHKGEMPPRAVGFRPLTIPPLDMQIEDIVRGIHADSPILAIVLRAYYCGSGRQGVERRHTAEAMFGRRIRRDRYYTYHALGFQRVAGALSAIARAA